MALSIPPIAPLIGVSPISAFDRRDVLVPLPVNPATREILESDEGNIPSNRDLFESELETSRGVIVPLPETNPGVQEALEENGGNVVEDTRNEEIEQEQDIEDRSIAFLRNNRANDDIFQADLFSDVETVPQLSLQSVIDLQEIPEVINPQSVIQPATQLSNLQNNTFNIYNYVINVLQGGANEYYPHLEEDNTRVDFQA